MSRTDRGTLGRSGLARSPLAVRTNHRSKSPATGCRSTGPSRARTPRDIVERIRAGGGTTHRLPERHRRTRNGTAANPATSASRAKSSHESSHRVGPGLRRAPRGAFTRDDVDHGRTRVDDPPAVLAVRDGGCQGIGGRRDPARHLAGVKVGVRRQHKGRDAGHKRHRIVRSRSPHLAVPTDADHIGSGRDHHDAARTVRPDQRVVGSDRPNRDHALGA